MEQYRFYLSYGGGIGDVWWDYLRDPAARRIASLAEDHGAKVRIYTQCHCDAVDDLFRIHPHIYDHISEPWRLPNAEDSKRFREPIGDWIPLQRMDWVLQTVGMIHRLVEPAIHVSESERVLLDELLSVRPCIVVQPYAGLSDRDALNPPALRRLVDEIVNLNHNARILVVGKNHERGCKYSTEVGIEHPNVVDLIDQLGIRVAFHLVARCDAFCGAHSNLIRVAWDFRRRNICVLPDPLMTRHIPQLDGKYTYGFGHEESRTFTYPFDHGQPRAFEQLDFAGMARHLLGR